jgi:glutathione S-transferase
MKLYWSPNACSLSPHIVLREAGLPFEMERVDLRANRTASGGDFRAINPKGYVPALQLDDGEILTEGAVIVQYLADLAPDAKLAPPAGTMARVRLQEWLHFIGTELHKGMSPLYNPLASAEFKQSLRERLAARFGFLAGALADGRAYLTGDSFSIADAYAFYTLRAWRRNVAEELPAPALQAYFDRIAARPAVRAALQAEA